MELARIVRFTQSELDVVVLVYAPEIMQDGWERTDLWDSFSSIPGVRVIADVDGEQIKQFGARTSGECALFDENGTLVFGGGITSGRGHEGDNIGSQSIIAFSRGHSIPASYSHVFGCNIFGSDQTDSCPECDESDAS